MDSVPFASSRARSACTDAAAASRIAAGATSRRRPVAASASTRRSWYGTTGGSSPGRSAAPGANFQLRRVTCQGKRETSYTTGIRTTAASFGNRATSWSVPMGMPR